MNTYVLTIGATNRYIEVTLMEEDETLINLTGATVHMIYRKVGTTTPKQTKTMTVNAVPTTGKARYDWLTADMTALTTGGAGDWAINWKVTHSDTSVDYFPSRVDGSADDEIYDILRVRNPV